MVVPLVVIVNYRRNKISVRCDGPQKVCLPHVPKSWTAPPGLKRDIHIRHLHLQES